MIVSLIAAVGKNREIGKDGKLPWRLPADLSRFRELTKGHAVIMGRKTYESIGRPLPDRENFVVTRQADYEAPGCIVVGSLAGAIKQARGDEAFVIGGAEIYREALPYAARMYLTEIDETFPADTYFPEFDRALWHEVERTPGLQDKENPYRYAFLVLEKNQPSLVAR
jgi:dihydrofolate reductase